MGYRPVPGVAAEPSHSVFILPWAGSKANTNWSTRSQASTVLGGGTLRNDGSQNSEINWDIWLDAGTYKFALIHQKDSDRGIYSVQLNDVAKGTIDGYAASGVSNVYDESVSGIAITAGLYEFSLKMLTKNASSTAYQAAIQSCAWIRTGA